MISFSNKQISNQYKTISEYHNKFLKKHDVKLPKLKVGHVYNKSALVLVYLSINYPNNLEISKSELTEFIRMYHPNVNDVQQARHLAAQSGWWILSGSRNDISENINKGCYKLHSLTEPYPGFKNQHRLKGSYDWDDIKRKYGYRCATCGSKEGEPHFHWRDTRTKLEQGHKDPNKKLTLDNIIPQCKSCNRADKNRWVYDDYGRVIKLANAEYVRNFDLTVRKKIYMILSKEFGND